MTELLEFLRNRLNLRMPEFFRQKSSGKRLSDSRNPVKINLPVIVIHKGKSIQSKIIIGIGNIGGQYIQIFFRKHCCYSGKHSPAVSGINK